MEMIYIKRILLNIVSASVIFLSCSKGSDTVKENEPEKDPKPVIRVMTYNIHIGNPPSKPADFRDLDAIADVINRQKPDLVALQEVDVKTKRSGLSINQAEELGKLTGMHVFFTKAIDFDGGQFGDAVLSRFPILESVRYELPVAKSLGGEMRSAAMITVEKEGRRFHFASTHLDHLAAEDNRLVQADSLVKIIKNLQLPLIIAGDLNASPASKTLSILKKELTWGCKLDCPLTFSAQNPKSTIDYILVNNPDKFSFRNYHVVNEAYASDHLPVIAEIELK